MARTSLRHATSPEDMAEMLSDLIGQRLGVGGSTLTERLSRAAPRMPRRVRRDIETVAEAAGLSAHPKIAPQLDLARLHRAAARASEWLLTYDRPGHRRDRILDFLALTAFNLLVVAAGVIAVLVWRGLV